MPAVLRAEAINPAAELIRELETAKGLPEAAIHAAVAQAEAIEPAVLALVELAADGALLTPGQTNLLVFGLPALAAARRRTIYQPLVRMLRRLPRHELEWIFGDANSEFFAPILLAVFDGDATPLIEGAMDPSVDGFTRWVFWGVLARLTFDGTIRRSSTLDLLQRFERENLAKAEDPAWKAWQQVIVLLGFEELRDRMRATWADGRNPERKVDQEAEDEALTATLTSAPEDAAQFVQQSLAPLSDPLQSLRRWQWDEDSDRAGSPDTFQDNDASLPLALNQSETDWMDEFLARRFGAPDEAWEAIDGFYCALIVGPSSGDIRKYIPQAIEFGEGPRFDSPQQADYVTGLLTRYWASISDCLASRKLHGTTIADADYPRGAVWAASFLRGVTLRSAHWEQIQNQTITLALATMMTLTGRLKAGDRPLTRQLRDQLVAALPLLLRSMYDILHGLRDPLARASLTADFGFKVGRNEPCPCGSRKKYKRCCGSADRRAEG